MELIPSNNLQNEWFDSESFRRVKNGWFDNESSRVPAEATAADFRVSLSFDKLSRILATALGGVSSPVGLFEPGNMHGLSFRNLA